MDFESKATYFSYFNYEDTGIPGSSIMKAKIKTNKTKLELWYAHIFILLCTTSEKHLFNSNSAPQTYAVLIMCQALYFLWNKGNIS